MAAIFFVLHCNNGNKYYLKSNGNLYKAFAICTSGKLVFKFAMYPVKHESEV